MSAAIEIKNLRKQYRGGFAPAVDGLSMDMEAGKITGLLGPNGAGKTTTIGILCGLVAPTGGTASVFGRDVSRHNTFLRRQTGFVPQQIALFSNLTATENFSYIGALYGLKPALIKDRSRYLLDRLGLSQHADRRVGRYSGGMKRRANIIASLLHEPELIILDEPTAGVDVQSRAMILGFLQECRAKGKTIVYTSHLLDEAEQICDSVAVMDAGRLVLSGVPVALVAGTAGARRLEDVFLHYTGHSIRD